MRKIEYNTTDVDNINKSEEVVSHEQKWVILTNKKETGYTRTPSNRTSCSSVSLEENKR